MNNRQYPKEQPGTLLDASLFHKRVACERLALGGTIVLQTVCPGKAPRMPRDALTPRLPLARVAATLVVLLLPLLAACGTPHLTAAVSRTHASRAPATALHPLTNPTNPYPVLAAADGAGGLLDVYAGSLSGDYWWWQYGDIWTDLGPPHGGPTARLRPGVGTNTGYVLFFVTDRNGNLSCDCASNGWPVLPGLANTVTSDPGVGSWGWPRTDVMAWTNVIAPPGNSYYLQHDWSTTNTPYPTQWSWELLPGFPHADPTLAPLLVSRGPNLLDVFALGTDHALYALSWNGSRWGQWQDLGGYLLYGQVAAVPMSSSEVDVFVIGGDHQLYEQVLSGTTRSGWIALGGYLVTAPTAVSWASGIRTVCALGSDYGMWCQDGFGGTWKGWYAIGGIFAPSWLANSGTLVGLPPVSTSLEVAELDVFAVSGDGQVWWQEGLGSEGGISWTGWQSLGFP